MNELHNSITFDQLFSVLLKNAYSQQEQTELRNKLINTYQKDYELIEEYRADLEDLLTVLGIISGKTQEDIKLQVRESFFNNLHAKTKYEMSRLGVFDFDEMCKRIKDAEQTIKNIKSSKIDDQNDTKWCKYHRTNSHNSEECYQAKNKREQKSKHSTDRTRQNHHNKETYRSHNTPNTNYNYQNKGNVNRTMIRLNEVPKE